MIYFDRIEVVNFLIQSAGEYCPQDPADQLLLSCWSEARRGGWALVWRWGVGEHSPLRLVKP